MIPLTLYTHRRPVAVLQCSYRGYYLLLSRQYWYVCLIRPISVLLFRIMANSLAITTVPRLTTVRLNPDMDCPQTWHLAHRWLDQCQSHELCSRRPEHWLKDEDWLPTRLITWDPFDESHVRVVVAKQQNVENLRPYVTPSHCWGNVDTLKLPNLLFDTVTIARRIGARSIWVDKMCIIQDSDHDWRKEAALMEYV